MHSWQMFIILNVVFHEVRNKGIGGIFFCPSLTNPGEALLTNFLEQFWQILEGEWIW